MGKIVKRNILHYKKDNYTIDFTDGIAAIDIWRDVDDGFDFKSSEKAFKTAISSLIFDSKEISDKYIAFLEYPENSRFNAVHRIHYNLYLKFKVNIYNIEKIKIIEDIIQKITPVL